MFTVKNCLCFDLETGGKIIGLIGFILNIFVLCITIILLVATDTFTWIAASGDSFMLLSLFLSCCGTMIAGAVISYFCLKGIENTNPSYLTPTLLWLALSAFYSFSGILFWSWESILFGSISFLIYGYFYIVIYSIYSKFMDLYRNGHAIKV